MVSSLQRSSLGKFHCVYMQKMEVESVPFAEVETLEPIFKSKVNN